jgi:ketosteroid isomerase-like protein
LPFLTPAKRLVSLLEPAAMPHRARIAVSALALSLVCCNNGNKPIADAAIRGEMDRQALAWNRGDIPGFMAAYADSICFISAKERTCGKALVTKRYMNRYPNKATMGKLEFGQLEILPAGADHAWCTGTWRLARRADTLSGGFSLFWVLTPAGWRILRDHTY